MSAVAYILLADGFEELEALAPADILRRMQIETVLVGVSGRTVTGAHGIAVQADQTLHALRDTAPQALLLPGGLGGSKLLDANKLVGAMCRRVAEQGGLLAAICAAPMVLGRLGLLQGRRATCYPGFEEHLHGAEITGEDVTVDGRVITARGAGVACDFAFAVGAALCGETEAQFVRRAMQFPAV